MLGLRKFTQILLSALFLFNSIGYIFAYYQLGYIFKQEAAYKIIHKSWTGYVSIIEDSPLVEKTDINEIRFSGMKYDIIQKEIKNGKVIYYCLSDQQENNLYNILINQVENNTASTSSAPVKNILSNIISDILLPIAKTNVENVSDIEYFTHNIVNHPIPEIKIFTPPPQYI